MANLGLALAGGQIAGGLTEAMRYAERERLLNQEMGLKQQALGLQERELAAEERRTDEIAAYRNKLVEYQQEVEKRKQVEGEFKNMASLAGSLLKAGDTKNTMKLVNEFASKYPDMMQPIDEPQLVGKDKYITYSGGGKGFLIKVPGTAGGMPNLYPLPDLPQKPQAQYAPMAGGGVMNRFTGKVVSEPTGTPQKPQTTDQRLRLAKDYYKDKLTRAAKKLDLMSLKTPTGTLPKAKEGEKDPYDAYIEEVNNIEQQFNQAIADINAGKKASFEINAAAQELGLAIPDSEDPFGILTPEDEEEEEEE